VAAAWHGLGPALPPSMTVMAIVVVVSHTMVMPIIISVIVGVHSVRRRHYDRSGTSDHRGRAIGHRSRRHYHDRTRSDQERQRRQRRQGEPDRDRDACPGRAGQSQSDTGDCESESKFSFHTQDWTDPLLGCSVLFISRNWLWIAPLQPTVRYMNKIVPGPSRLVFLVERRFSTIRALVQMESDGRRSFSLFRELNPFRKRQQAAHSPGRFAKFEDR